VNGDIEVEIGAGSGAGRYAVKVLRSAAGGEPSGTLELDVDEVLSRRDLLAATVLASGVSRRSVPLAEQPVRQVGTQLFEALFSGPVYGMYRASLGVAQERGKRLRVVLRLTAPELAALPWEMLFDPETETYLCRQEPLVRHVHAPYTAEPLAVPPPLRILGVVASPRGLSGLDAEAEQAHLAEALAVPVADGLVEVTWAPEATWHGVQGQLLAGQWHVLHFVGHGDYDAGTDEGVIFLAGPDGRADRVEAGRLADLLGEARPTPRLVVLNSCSSGQAGTDYLFSGTAAALVRSGISAVAAMQFAISDDAAIAFARGFYTAIVNGRDIDEAARSGRISILGVPRSLEWVTPVLYVRGRTAQLFTLASPPAADRDTDAPAAQPPAAPPAGSVRRRQAELRALYIEARAELRLEHFDTAIGLFDDLLVLDPGYPDAARLRDVAWRGGQLAEAYALAAAAADAGDWGGAARGFGQVLQTDPSYRDAAARKAACEARQQAADLKAELLHHASTGQWQAVLDVSAELAQLDPAESDPDGWATRARAALAAEQRTADLGTTTQPPAPAEPAAHREPAAPAARLLWRINYSRSATSVSWHPGGSRIAVATLGNYSRIHDLSGTEPRELMAVKGTSLVAGILALAFSPDGKLLATGNSYSKARIWDTASGHRLFDLDHTSAVNAVAFSPDGTRLATASEKNARIWAAATGKKLLEVGHARTLNGVAFSPDGTRLATASYDETARIWGTADGKQLLEVHHGDTVRAVAFSPDGTRLATASDDETAQIWDAATGQELLHVRHRAAVRAVAFSPDGTRLATASAGYTARIWDAATGQQLLQVRHDGVVRAVAFSPDGTRLATASQDKSVRIWDVSGV
jgi:tetratricopeptide (TPR) repeat protein